MTELHFLPEQRFECTACGKCCRDWKVRVDSKAREVVTRSEAAAAVERKGYVPLVVADDGETRLGQKSNGTCVFLAEDLLCDLHREVGLVNKPAVCQTYPRLITATPDGYFVSLSFTCPAVLVHEGAPVVDDREPLGQLLDEFGAQVPQNVPVTEAVRLTNERTVSWQDYLSLETRLLEAFDPSEPALSALSMAEALLRHGVEEFSPPKSPSELGLQLLDIFTLHSLSVIELEKDPEKRARFIDRLACGESLKSVRHGFTLHLSDVTSRARPQDRALIRTYFQNIVFGKRLLTTTLVDGLLTFSVGMALLLFYLELFRRETDDADARIRAFDIVEADVVTHSSGLDELLDEFGRTLAEHL